MKYYKFCLYCKDYFATGKAIQAKPNSIYSFFSLESNQFLLATVQKKAKKR